MEYCHHKTSLMKLKVMKLKFMFRVQHHSSLIRPKDAALLVNQKGYKGFFRDCNLATLALINVYFISMNHIGVAYFIEHFGLL